MKVVLISPAKNRKGERPSRELFPPLGLMCLAAYTPKGVDVELIDENVQPINFENVPDLVGVTTLTATAHRAYEIAERYRKSGAKVILGGIHASMVPEEALKHADSVVVGEAEDIWPQVISDASSNRLEPLYTQESFIDFKRPHLPRRDLIDSSHYWFANAVQTARGCPHNCSFCSVTAYNGRRVRTRDVDSVLAEIDSLFPRSHRRRRMVAFVDDNIGANPRRAKELFEALIPMNIMWGSQACISFANNEELVALAAESGCRFLCLGLEALSPQALAEMNKRHNKVENYESGLQMLKKYGIHVMGAFVFGFDSTDEPDFANTFDFAMENKLTLAQFSTLIPYPGTRLYTQLLDEKRLKPGFWLDPSWTNHVVFEPNNMSASELRNETFHLQRKFYSYRAIMKRSFAHRHWILWLVANIIYHRAVKKKHS